MARTVLYHLVHLQTGTIANAANAQILRGGRLVGIRASVAGIGGAATGYVATSLELNNTAQANGDTNNPPRETVLFTHQSQWANATGAAQQASGISPYVPCNVPLQIGDTISASQVQTGTAPATLRTHIDAYVLED